MLRAARHRGFYGESAGGRRFVQGVPIEGSDYTSWAPPHLRAAGECQAYPTTKLTLEGLSDVTRRELAPLGAGVTPVRPDAIDTDLFGAIYTITLTNPVPDGVLARRRGRRTRRSRGSATVGGGGHPAMRSSRQHRTARRRPAGR